MTTISADFPFESNFVEVHGSKMHYVEEGTGDPVLFLHGNPTSSYLWRNIIPHVSPHARCIAPDLIGMGKSAKPDIPYRFHDHASYLDGFIEALGLENITLVLHDWGSGLGFHYAHRHPDNIKAIAFMEALLAPMRWSDFPPDHKMGFKLFRAPGTGWMMLQVMNAFITKLMPQMIARTMTAEEWGHYNSPYPTIASRKPIRQWPCEIPIDGTPSDVHTVITGYRQWLEETELPKLFFYADPGGIITVDQAAGIEEAFKNLRSVALGTGFHYVQEDNPHLIGETLAEWYQEL